MLTRLALVLGLLLLGACPRGDGGGTGPGTGSGTASKPTLDAGVTEIPDRTPGDPLLPPGGVDAPKLACVYHAAGAGYFTCTNGNAGTCFHFGAPCNPADACMFDATTSTYKTCAMMVEGTCSSWGAGCTPANACMFEPKSGLHHTCDRPDDGACTAWGGLCDPA